MFRSAAIAASQTAPTLDDARWGVGGSNKSIEINLCLIHWTMGIHRARMMRKLTAGSTGYAVIATVH